MDPETSEELESVPWDALLAEQPSQWRRWAGMAGVAAVVLAVSASAARTFWPATPTPVASPTTSLAEPAVTTTITEDRPIETVSVTEADLLAVDPNDQKLVAAGYAAWVAAQYFTVDGSGIWGGRELVADAEASFADTARSYVERAEPVEVMELGGGRFAVTVLVSRLVASDDGYVRHRPVALEVVLEIADTSVRIVDLPRPLPTPDLIPAVSKPGEDELPTFVRISAEADGSWWGTVDPVSLRGSRSHGGWRVTMTVVDEAGMGWPVSVWLDAEGEPVAPPGDTAG